MRQWVVTCDECGEEIGPDNKWVECEACGKQMCLVCTGRMDSYLCPTHYQKVQEFIEGLKEPDRVYISPWINMSAQGEVDEIWVSGVKFVPEKDEGLKAKEPTFRVTKYVNGYEVRKAGEMSYFMPLENANALYEHIRRERNGEG